MRKGSTVGESGLNGLLRNSSCSGFPWRPPELILRSSLSRAKKITRARLQGIYSFGRYDRSIDADMDLSMRFLHYAITHKMELVEDRTPKKKRMEKIGCLNSHLWGFANAP